MSVLLTAACSPTHLHLWTARHSCLEVTCELRAEMSPPIKVYRIRKVCNSVTVPALVPMHFDDNLIRRPPRYSGCPAGGNRSVEPGSIVQLE